MRVLYGFFYQGSVRLLYGFKIKASTRVATSERVLSGLLQGILRVLPQGFKVHPGFYSCSIRLLLRSKVL